MIVSFSAGIVIVFLKSDKNKTATVFYFGFFFSQSETNTWLRRVLSGLCDITKGSGERITAVQFRGFALFKCKIPVSCVTY